MKHITQKKIAELAGVSQPTVSRVLAADSGVDPESRARVMELVDSHGYQPHALARGLRTKRTDTIALAIRRGRKDFAKDPFYWEFITAVVERASTYGIHLSVCASRSAGGERSFYDSLFTSRRVDGLLILESEERDERIERLRSGRFPFVLIGRYESAQDVCTVDNDNVGGMGLVMKHLIGLGHRRIAYISGPPTLTVSHDRLLGYTNSLTEAGIPYDANLVAEADFGEQRGRKAAERLLRRKPTALVAFDDLIGLGALAAIKAAGLRVPKDIALVGFNDSMFCSHTDPPMTSVCLNVPELGAQAAELLIQRIKDPNRPSSHVVVPCRLVERSST